MVECGCEGKSVTTEDSGGDSFRTVTTAIVVLVALAVLLVLVLACFCFVKRRRVISTQASKAGELFVGILKQATK